MKILIAGGSGLVGSRLTNHLIAQGHQVNVLTRKKFRHLKASVYEWKPSENYIEEGALDQVDAVVNLAGAGVADKPWTTSRKRLILESRVQSADCLYANLEKMDTPVPVVVNASAIGYYGFGNAERLFHEQDVAGSDYLADVCVKWEAAADRLSYLGVRLVKIRIGVVLDEKGGALKKMSQPVKYYMGAPLGSGDQMISWIHVEDMYRMIQYAIETPSLKGTYNAVSSPPISNKEFTKVLGEVLNKPVFLPNVPSFVLKLMLGEMSTIVLQGSSVSNEKIKATGFEFKYLDLKEALLDLL